MIKLLFHAREAGIATIIKSLITQIDRSKFEVFFDVDDDAKNILKKCTVYDFNTRVDAILYGVDAPKVKRTEDFLNRVEKINAPKIALLDTWKGVDRFWDEQKKLRFQIEHVFTTDNCSLNDLINNGIESNKISLVKNPVLETIKPLDKQNKLKTLKELKLKDNVPVLLFLSEPLTLINNDGYQSLFEVEVKDYDSVVEYIQTKYKNYQFVFRTHPVEKKIKPSGWMDLSSNELEEVLQISDVVVGLSSTPMSYAVRLGLKVETLAYLIHNWEPSQCQISHTTWNTLYLNGIIQNEMLRVQKKINNSVLPITIMEAIESLAKK